MPERSLSLYCNRDRGQIRILNDRFPLLVVDRLVERALLDLQPFGRISQHSCSNRRNTTLSEKGGGSV